MSLRAISGPHHLRECEAGVQLCFEPQLENQIMYNTRRVAEKAGEHSIAVPGSDYGSGGCRSTVSEGLNLTREGFIRPAAWLVTHIEKASKIGAESNTSQHSLKQ